MTAFRLTQISDTHLSRRLPKLIRNFERIAEHVEATRPNLVLNTGDIGFDGPNQPDDLAFARSLHDALPVACRYLPGNHDIGDNPTQIGPVPKEKAGRAISRCSGMTTGVSRQQAGVSSGSTRW